MRNSFAKCGLTGRNYIGGVAGYGMNVSGCNTLVNLNGTGNCVGTIAGEIDKDGSALITTSSTRRRPASTASATRARPRA